MAFTATNAKLNNSNGIKQPSAVYSESTTGFTVQAFAIIILASALLFTSPALSKKLSYAASSREVALSYATVVAAGVVLSILPFFPNIGGTDIIVAGCLCHGKCMYSLS